MDDLVYLLGEICRHNRDGSYTTQGDRLRSLTRMARQLRALGFRNMRPSSLRRKHVDALVAFWTRKPKSAGTLKNRLAHLRWWAEKVGKQGAVPGNAVLGIPDRRYVTNENKARDLGPGVLNKIRDRYVRMSLTLQLHFGLRRDAIERVLLDPIRTELLSPERRQRMAKEMQAQYVEWIKAATERAGTVSQEAAELDARISRLRDRLKNGDPDLTPDELQAAIERVENKRRDLDHARNTVSSSAQILSILPKAAEYYGQQIALGLDGDRDAAAKARPIVRELLGGKVDLVPGEGGSLWAEYSLHKAALLQGAGTGGRGDRI